MARHINDAGLDLIKMSEGLTVGASNISEAYLCPAGVWTIGYGHTKNVKEGDTASLEQCDIYLQEDLRDSVEAVERLIRVPLSGDQFAALVSFTFNCGGGALEKSTLRKRLNLGDYDCVPYQLSRWCKATVNGRRVSLPGLVKRRAAEGVLFASSIADHGIPQKVELM